ncbi:MAG: ZIP family metal transporter [Gaiellaceae bacterium]
MLEAAFWGLVTAGSLWVGFAIAAARPSNRWIGLAMAFGSGALIAAVAYELVLEAFETDLTLAAVGFAAGGLTFYVGDWAIDRRGGHGRKGVTGESQLAGSANAIVLGTVLDGIPESFVLGASLLQEGVVPIAVVVGVFVSNVPESLSGTSGLLEAGWTRGRIFAMWSSVVFASVLAAAAGWLLLDAMPTAGGAFALAFAGGALLVMLADTLMPEAFELGGREAGLATALGFALGFALS